MGPGAPPPRYPGPGDILPTPTASTPSSPSTPAPSSPSPSSPSTPDRTPPGAGPRSTPPPLGPSTPPASSGQPPATLHGNAGASSTSWERWWSLNQDRYLGLQRSLRAGLVATASDEFYLGHGAREGATADGALPSDVERSGAIEVLTELLANEPGPEIEAAALLALARLGAGEADKGAIAAAIRPHLDDGATAVAEAATAALGVLGDPAEVALLVSLVSCQVDDLRADHGLEFGAHVPDRVRARAAYALGLLGERASGYWRLVVVDALQGAVMGEFHRTRSRDVQVAGEIAMGLVALPIDASGACEAIARPRYLVYRQQQIRWLLATLDDRELDREVKAQAPVSVARLLAGSPSSFALRELAARRLLAELASKSSDADVRRGCAVALGWIGDADGDAIDAEIREGLAQASASNADVLTRRFATLALGEVAGRPGVGAGDAVAGHALAARRLLAGLGAASGEQRAWSAVALGLMQRSLGEHGLAPNADASTALRLALSEARAPEEIGACATAVGLARDPQAGELLLAAFERAGEEGARAHVAVALGMARVHEAGEALAGLASEGRQRPALLRAASIGLALLGDREFLRGLCEELERDAPLSTQLAVCSAFERAAFAPASDALASLALEKREPDVARAAAASALGAVLDREELPWTSRLVAGAHYATETAASTGLFEAH